MADTRLRAIIESIYESRGTDSAKAGMQGVKQATAEMGIAQQAAQAQVDMLTKKMRELSGEVEKGNKTIDEATKEFNDYKSTLTKLPPAMDQITTSTDETGGSVSALSGVLSKLAAAGLLAKIGQEALEFGKASVQAAGDAAEMQSKFDVVFGESAPQAQQALQDLGAQVNRSAIDLQGMAASIQDTFVPLGFARDEAAALSVQLTQLAVDVGSFNNVADADVMRDFQSALVGNTETVRKYGIVITEANTKQKAYAMGIAEAGEALTEQEKVQARLQLILEGTSDAQGDAIRTADSYANTQKGLEAATLDLKVALGELATTGLAGASQEVTVLVKNLTDLIGWIGKVQAISDEHNRTVALSTATYEDYAAEVVRVAVVTGKLNEKQAEIVLATYKNADANTELSGTMQKLGADIGLLTEAERLQLQQVNALTAAYEAAGVTAYTWTEVQTKANEITVEWADNTFYANQALEMQADDMYLAYTTSEKFADRLQLVNDKAVALTEALHNAKPSIDEMRDALNQDISSPLDDFINDIEFFVASGGRDFVAEFENIQQKLADAMAAPGDDAFALQQAKEDAAALLVDIEKVKVAMGEKTEFEAAQSLAEQLGVPLEDALGLLKDFEATADRVFGTERNIAINQESLDDLHDKLQEAEGSINTIEGEHEVIFNITTNGAIPTLDGANVESKGTTAVATAGGGDVYPGQSYWVGEQGTEMFVPNVPGTIIPNNKLGSAGENISIAPTIVNVYLDGQRIEAAMEIRQGQRYRQRTGGGYRP